MLLPLFVRVTARGLNGSQWRRSSAGLQEVSFSLSYHKRGLRNSVRVSDYPKVSQLSEKDIRKDTKCMDFNFFCTGSHISCYKSPIKNSSEVKIEIIFKLRIRSC